MEERRNNSEVLRCLGELTGSVKMMAEASSRELANIRDDIRRMRAEQSERMDRIENSLTRRIDEVKADVKADVADLSARVTSLEVEDKRIIAQTARLSAMGGSVGGAIAAAAVELIKRFG